MKTPPRQSISPFLTKDAPYRYHEGVVKDWHLPTRMSISELFGVEVSTYVAENKAKIQDFPNCPRVTLNENNAQTLIDVLTKTTQFW
jgi:hypothetical protein